jgi:predicted Fe-S protein YdhL (DUF1289 family)
MIITEARIGYYERLKDELDEIVHALAKKYCEIFGINFAYGVDVWYIEWKSVNVRLDQTCRGCYSSEDIVLDRSWLTMPFENTVAVMKEQRQAQLDKIEAEAKKRKAREIANLEGRLRVLRGEVS